MNKITKDLGLSPAPEPLRYGVRIENRRPEYVKIPGESKATRRLRRRELVR